MYLFSFQKFAGPDRVFATTLPCGNPGDLLKTQDDMVLNLGTDIAFPELVTQTYPAAGMDPFYPAFFDQHFLSFLHRMVYWWYSSYKTVIKYFVSLDIQDLLMREQKADGKKTTNPFSSLGTHSLSASGQNLLIFPDNWTRYMVIPSTWFTTPEVINLVSTDTQNRKDIHRRMLKKGAKGPIIATHSEVFQPYACLKKIFLFDPQKWYYHNQQDPRYSLPTVIHQMGKLYGAEVVEMSNEGAIEGIL